MGEGRTIFGRMAWHVRYAYMHGGGWERGTKLAGARVGVKRQYKHVMV
jgi:hypothetical protein